MNFCNSHLTLQLFNLDMRRFFFGLVYVGPTVAQIEVFFSSHESFSLFHHSVLNYNNLIRLFPCIDALYSAWRIRNLVNITNL